MTDFRSDKRTSEKSDLQEIATLETSVDYFVADKHGSSKITARQDSQGCGVVWMGGGCLMSCPPTHFYLCTKEEKGTGVNFV